jgi:hypothetical protein
VRTQGLRYPICQYQSFDAIFREVATKVVVESELSCQFTVSSVPEDSSFDNARMAMVAGDGGASIPLVHVGSAEQCAGDAFYVEGAAIKLCPDACVLWREDPTLTANVEFTCSNQVQ